MQSCDTLALGKDFYVENEKIVQCGLGKGIIDFKFIIETVKKHFPGEKIHAVFGGTHLVPYNPQRVAETVKYFNESGIQYAGVCHCTGPAIADFADKVICYVKTGAGLTIEFED